MRKKKHEMDMCHGPLLSKMIIFAVPLMLSGVLQLAFNAADIMVVGRYVGSTALAAVGSTGSLINLLLNLLMGLSVGTNVIVARFYGAREEGKVSQAVHTSILLSVLCGVVMIGIGILLAEPLLSLMGTPENVLEQAAVYMRIYFAGMPVIMLYNFGSAVLRAVGDTKRPMYFLIIAGVANLIMNLIFVLVFHMGVAGVALATILSQVISAGLVVMCLLRSHSCIRLHLQQLKIHKGILVEIAKVGLPAGLQGMLFNISNVLIQSSINSFGELAMAGNSAGGNIEGFVSICNNAIHQAALCFTSQNYGAKTYSRIRRVRNMGLMLVTVIGGVLGVAVTLGAPVLLKLYVSDPVVIQYGIRKMQFTTAFILFAGMLDVMVGCLRGIGSSLLPMMVSLAGACGFRLIWIFTVFQQFRTLEILYVSYPISWALTGLVQFICFLIVSRKIPKVDMEETV